MAVPKVSLLLLFFAYGVVLLGMSESSMGAKACPLYCLDVDYMTCNSSGEEKLAPKCNCCLAPKQCTLHLTDGTTLSCS